jgi:MFS family permease
MGVSKAAFACTALCSSTGHRARLSWAASSSSSRCDLLLVFALTSLLYVGLGAVTGALTDRLGPRRLCAVGSAAPLLGLALASQARAPWQLYVTYSLFVGLAIAAAYVPVVSAVQRWYTRRRALVSGLAVSGIGAGTLLEPIVGRWLTQAYGWRTSYLVAARVRPRSRASPPGCASALRERSAWAQTGPAASHSRLRPGAAPPGRVLGEDA